jgi:hypothetical protein
MVTNLHASVTPDCRKFAKPEVGSDNRECSKTKISFSTRNRSPLPGNACSKLLCDAVNISKFSSARKEFPCFRRKIQNPEAPAAAQRAHCCEMLQHARERAREEVNAQCGVVL